MYYVDKLSNKSFLSPFSGLLNIPKNKWVAIACAALSLVALTFAWHYFFGSRTAREIVQKEGNEIGSDPIPVELKKGFAVIPFLPQEEIRARFADVENFDALPDDDKKQYSEKEVEFGYARLKGKEVFVIRNENVPKELANLLPYLSKVHTVALDILHSIEKELSMEKGTLTSTVLDNALPEGKKSTSLLRLFAYDPSEEKGMAAEAHEDLGLLTIIPRSNAPSLEVFDTREDHFAWVNIEKEAKEGEAIVLVGNTLEKMSGGQYLAATHRVIKSPQKRFSLVYQLRAEPHVKIKHENQEITVEQWLQKLKANLTSVNGSY